MARFRADVMRATREFFRQREYLEVDTPLLSPNLIPESPIEVFKTSFLSPYTDSRDFYLIPSPEIWMKRLLADGWGNIFQICRSFRNVESIGRHHNPEFTMLEWYTLNENYLGSVTRMEQLMEEILPLAAPEAREIFRPPFQRVSVRDAVLEGTDIDLMRCRDRQVLEDEVRRIGLSPEPGTSWEDLFNLVLVSHVEPSLPKDRAVVLYNYPSRIPTLAKEIPGTPWSERWELYAAGIELANCYTEETDHEKVAQFFDRELERKRGARVLHRIDEEYPELFARSFPSCSGVALGMDRLVMLLAGKRRIEGVIFFPFPDIL